MDGAVQIKEEYAYFNRRAEIEQMDEERDSGDGREQTEEEIKKDAPEKDSMNMRIRRQELRGQRKSGLEKCNRG